MTRHYFRLFVGPIAAASLTERIRAEVQRGNAVEAADTEFVYISVDAPSKMDALAAVKAWGDRADLPGIFSRAFYLKSSEVQEC